MRVCLLCFFFVLLYCFIVCLFSKNRYGIKLGRWGREMNLGGVGGGEIKIIKYFIKSIFNLKNILKIEVFIKKEVLKFCLTDEACDLRISEET